MKYNFDEIENYFNDKIVNQNNIEYLIKKYNITPTEIVFIYQKNKSISKVLPRYWEYTGKKSSLKYTFKVDLLFRIFLMQNGYLSLPFPLFLGLLTGYLLYSKMDTKEKKSVSKVVKRYSQKSEKDYVVPEKDLEPYIELIKRNWIQNKYFSIIILNSIL